MIRRGLKGYCGSAFLVTALCVLFPDIVFWRLGIAIGCLVVAIRLHAEQVGDERADSQGLDTEEGSHG